MNHTKSIGETRKESNLLRNALHGNALFSGISGLISLLAAQSLATFTRIQEAVVFTILGMVLV